MLRSIAAAAALAALASTAAAQTANLSPTSPSAASPGNATRAAPSGSTAIPNPGQPQIGAPTPLERQEERKSEKTTGSVCKGC